MGFSIKVHGDILEREYYDFIQQYVPAYELIWKIYIGNDGQNQMIEIPSLSSKEKERRYFFSQYHYTALESLVLMDITKKRILESKVTNIKENLEVFNYLITYIAHAGRIYDMVRKMGDKLGIPDLKEDLYKYYQTRNELLHNKKIPYQLIEGEITIPIIESGEQINFAWNERKLWNDMDPNKFEFLNDFVNDTFNIISSMLNSALYRSYENIKKICETCEIKIEPNSKTDYSINADTSGSGVPISATLGSIK